MTAKQAYFKQTGEHGISLPDPVAMAIALNPALCINSSTHYVDIETSSDLTRGMTVVDRLNVAEDSRNQPTWAQAIDRRAKAHICWTLDIPGWKAALYSSLVA
jgi:purine nucleosidase